MINSAQFTRRHFLNLSAALGLSAPHVAFAKGIENKRFIFVLLRGGMDGLSVLIPTDNRINALRGTLIKDPSSNLEINSDFSLHPAFKTLKALYDAKEASFIHAAGTTYRERSHFDAQDFLEILGGGQFNDGWMNRVLRHIDQDGLALARSIPLALQGEAKVSNWSPPIFDQVSPDILDRISTLYSDDIELANALGSARANNVENMSINRRASRRFILDYPIALEAIGRIMSKDDGPGIGMTALNGWDTHVNQINEHNVKFEKLDNGFRALKEQLGNKWEQTCVVVCSEFGRTVAVNGTRGTDHGTGGLIMLLGGAIAGGEISGDWPGLKRTDLYHGRDLAPVNDVTAVLKGVVRDHLGISRNKLDKTIFPNSDRAFAGLIKS